MANAIIPHAVPSRSGGLPSFNEILQSTPLPLWKTYFRWHVLSDYSPFLSHRFADEHFQFYGRTLRGIEQQEVRWKRGVHAVENGMGDALGRIYVARYFPPEAKARMDQLVKNLLAAYRTDIQTLDWMGPDTREKAAQKLSKFTTKIAYPAKWRDYSALLGKPVDKDESHMTPQTVNAYYNPERNEIVFPAAIL
jgi:predicted metalloendopeptidase